MVAARLPTMLPTQLGAKIGNLSLSGGASEPVDGDITSVEILSDGWSADVTIKGWGTDAGSITYDDGLDASNVPTASTPTISTTSKSWTAGGVETTVGRTLYARQATRNPGLSTLDETASGDDLIIRVALSHFVYSGDTVGAFNFPAGWANNGGDSNASSGTCTSSSIRGYEKPIAQWVNHDEDWATSSSYTVEMVATHAHAQQGQGVRAIKFTATDDAANSASVTVSSESVKSYTASGFSCPVYSGSLDLSGLDQGDLLTIDATIYPWVGDSFTLSTDADTYPSPNLTTMRVLNDRTGAYGTVYAYVDGVGGSGAVSETPATAATTPFDTIANAASAIQTYNNSNFSRNNVSGGIIRLTAATHVHSSFSARAVGEIPLIIEAADAANKATTIYQDAGASVSNGFPDKFKLKDITLQKNGASVIFVDTAAAISSTNICVFENCDFDINGQTRYGAWVYRVGRIYASECTGDDCGQFTAFGTVAKSLLMQGCNVDGGLDLSIPYLILASKDLDSRFTKPSGNAGNPDAKGMFVGWSHIGNATNGEQIITVDSAIDSRGIAKVGNVIEQYGGTTNAAWYCNADTDSDKASDNIIDISNTVVGSRTNWLYDSAGATHPEKIGCYKYNYDYLWNTKSDLFPTIDAARVGNWTEIYHVGNEYNVFSEGSSNGTTFGDNQWMGQIAGIGFKTGSSGTPVDADFTSDASNQGTGLGNGDYSLGVSTQLVQIPSGKAPFAYDHKGTALADDGTDYIGALQ